MLSIAADRGNTESQTHYYNSHYVYIKSLRIKSIAIIALISLGSFLSGLKGRDFVKQNIYLPIRTSLKYSDFFTPYKKTDCPVNSLTIAIFGQSNSANFVSEKSNLAIPSNLYQYDWESQRCYLYKEPLLGANGKKGNVITYTAIKMANNSNKPIVIIPFGLGATSVLNWAYRDLFHNRHQIVMQRIKDSGLSPRIFLWHQGEADSNLPEEVYYYALRKIVESTFNSFPQSSFGIALATRCVYEPLNPLRSAQKRVSQDIPNAFISADSDKIYGLDKRPDNCHFSAKGATELGNLYYESITKEIKKKTDI